MCSGPKVLTSEPLKRCIRGQRPGFWRFAKGRGEEISRFFLRSTFAEVMLTMALLGNRGVPCRSKERLDWKKNSTGGAALPRENGAFEGGIVLGDLTGNQSMGSGLCRGDSLRKGGSSMATAIVGRKKFLPMKGRLLPKHRARWDNLA